MSRATVEDSTTEAVGTAEKFETSEPPREGPPTPRWPVEQESDVGPVNVVLTSAAAFLSTAGAGWVSAGIFRGSLAPIVAVLGSLLGTGIVALSYRARRPALIQYLAVPSAIVVATIFVLPSASGGSANLPSLVVEALRTGGVAQAPVPFDPGWRFLLFVILAALGACSASLGIALRRPRLAALIPVPLIFGAALFQPRASTVLTGTVAIVLLVAALGMSFGAELAREGGSSARFEARRFAKGVLMVGLLITALAGLSRWSLLFPEPVREQAVPPKKPERQPPQADRVLFTVHSDRPGPWRLGVLDVYQDGAWLLPPYDSTRFVDIPAVGTIPGPVGDRAVNSAVPPGVTATFTVEDVAGHVIPGIDRPRRVNRRGFALWFDPRAQLFRLPERRAFSGMTYTIEGAPPPGGLELSQAPIPPAAMREFLAAPVAPNEVVKLLADAPATNLWDRLQFVRNSLYNKVVAAGPGEPVDVPPDRVARLLEGGEATPYEITAAEALLARWAGIPARVGYGFYGGDRKEGQSTEWEVHPRHGATWLEAYFEGYGWIPIVGIPPKAKASLSEQEKQQNPQVRPSDELALIVYVPVKLRSIQLLFALVRYWVGVGLLIVLPSLLCWAFFPGPVKMARRFHRRRWAATNGIRPRIATAYAEMRDVAADLNVGDASATPLEFLAAIEQDAEHSELAWLLTRAVWGDLTRGLEIQDADAAEDMAQSVIRRLRRGQSLTTRILAFGSRASLRGPYSNEVPNLWPAPHASGAGARLRTAVARSFRVLRRLIPIGTALVLILLLLAACGRQAEQAPRAGLKSALPARLAPEALQGLELRREPSVENIFDKAGPDSLVTAGRIYTVRRGTEIVGYLEVAAFKPEFAATRREVRDGVLRSIATGRFEAKRMGTEIVWALRTGEQRFLIWFPPDGSYLELLVTKHGFEQAEPLLAALLDYQRDGKTVTFPSTTPVFDPLRGGEE